jgi:hypothetical protein
MTRRPHGQIEFFRPDGRPLPMVPRIGQLPGDVVALLRNDNRRCTRAIEDGGLCHSCPTAAPGAACDYDWAVQHLWMLREVADVSAGTC